MGLTGRKQRAVKGSKHYDWMMREEAEKSQINERKNGGGRKGGTGRRSLPTLTDDGR